MSEPAVSTLTEDQIEDTFKSLRETSEECTQSRANWTSDYTMSKHVSRSRNDLLEQLEKDMYGLHQTPRNKVLYKQESRRT